MEFDQRISALKNKLERVELNKDSKDFLENVLETLALMNENFGASKKDEIVGRVNDYYENRIAEIKKGKTQIEFDDMSQTFTMFILPLDGFANKNYETQFDLNKVNLPTNNVKFKPIYAGGWNPGENEHGLITTAKYCYTQIYGNGVVEVVDQGMISGTQISSQGIEDRIIEHVNDMFELLKLAEVGGDIIIRINILDTQEVSLLVNRERHWGHSNVISGDITLPDIWLTMEDNVSEKIKENMKVLIRKFGFIN